MCQDKAVIINSLKGRRFASFWITECVKGLHHCVEPVLCLDSEEVRIKVCYGNWINWESVSFLVPPALPPIMDQ
jgi:hypothetical protein